MSQFNEAKKEDKGQSNSTQKAIVDIAQAMASVFKKYNRQTRQRAAKKLCTSDGRRAVDQLAQNPNRPLNQFPKLAFREWCESNNDWVKKFLSDQDVKQIRFNDYMLNQKFSWLKSSFPKLDFLYDEKKDILSLVMSIAMETIDYKIVTKVLKEIFGNNLIIDKTDLHSPSGNVQMVQTDFQTAGDFEYPQVTFSNFSATGYWELETHISNVSNIPPAQLKNIVMDFQVKGDRADDMLAAIEEEGDYGWYD